MPIGFDDSASQVNSPAKWLFASSNFCGHQFFGHHKSSSRLYWFDPLLSAFARSGADFSFPFSPGAPLAFFGRLPKYFGLIHSASKAKAAETC